MVDRIEAILFDIGGTLRRTVRKGAAERTAGVKHILNLLGERESADALAETLSRRLEDYSRWARDTLIELNEGDLWTNWLLPDKPAGLVRKLAPQLNQLWRESTATRYFFDETRHLILELYRRGYRLGVVSNTISSVEVPQGFEALGISHCFKTVILSCVAGVRKPGPEIFSLAIQDLDISPKQVAYIGDSPSRDVFGAKNAGIATTVIIRMKEPFDLGPLSAALTPDHLIHSHHQLLEIFPPLKSTRAAGD